MGFDSPLDAHTETCSRCGNAVNGRTCSNCGLNHEQADTFRFDRCGDLTLTENRSVVYDVQREFRCPDCS